MIITKFNVTECIRRLKGIEKIFKSKIDARRRTGKRTQINKILLISLPCLILTRHKIKNGFSLII